MSSLDKEILIERINAVERHLKRVNSQLPKSLSDFVPESNASDAVILHLWQAVQIIIDISMSACIHFHLGTPKSYSDAFIRLAEAGYLENELAVRLCHAAGFRNRIVHAYEKLDMQKVYNIAQAGPADLRSFLASIAKRL